MSHNKSLRAHIDFIVNLRKAGKSFPEISEAFGKKFGIKKRPEAVSTLFYRHKHEYDLKGLKSTVEIKAGVAKEKLMKAFLSMVSKRRYIPIQAEYLKSAGLDHRSVERYFGNFEGLVKEAKENYPEIFESIIDHTSFNEQNFRDLRNYISKHQRFIITAAVTNCEPHDKALKAIETFCKAENAALLIIPCSDPARQSDKKNKWTLSDKLPKDKVVFKDVALNNNLMLSTIKMSAKQLQPLTGLRRIGQKNGSTFFASPKQFLEFAANSNSSKDIPRALMTTGAITKADYRSKTEMYMSDRTAYLADQDHKLGAIIVEIKNGSTFFFRDVEFEETTGAFCDIDKKYHANGKVEKISAELLQLGDYHVLSTDPVSKKFSKELAEATKPDYMTVEDFHDCMFGTPHEKNNILMRSIRAKHGLLSAEGELRANSKELDDLSTWPVKKIILKYGNHEDMLKRWISDADFVKDPANKILGMKLSIAMEELGQMPFEHAMRVLFPVKNQDKLRFLHVNESFKINGIENGAHGHIGKGGHKSPGLAEIEDCYGACNVGHNHSGAIWRKVYRAGTLTHMRLSYNDGSSTWTCSNVLQHRNGTRQLITCINGEWRLK